MAEGLPVRLRRGHATICLSIAEDEYCDVVEEPERFREWLARQYAESPELFPGGFAEGYTMKDMRTS